MTKTFESRLLKALTHSSWGRSLRGTLLLSLLFPSPSVFALAVMDAAHSDGASGPFISTGEQANLKSISYDENALHIRLDRSVPYRVFTLSRPARVVVELSHTIHGPRPYEASVTGGVLHRIRSAQFKTSPDMVTRIVLDVDKMMPYRTTREAGEIVLRFEGPSAGVEAQSVPSGLEEPIVRGVDQAEIAATAIERPGGRDGGRVKDLMASLPTNPITIDFDEAEVRDVIRVLAEMSGINMIYAADLRGFVTIHLDRVPFNEVLSTILTTQGLVAQQIGSNILRILTPEALNTDRARSVTTYKTFILNYGKASEIQSHLAAVKISPTAKVSVDERNNALIVTDTQEGIAAAERLIAELDRKPPQVLIETKIVQIDVGKALQLGVQWEFANTAQSGSTARTVGLRNTTVGKDPDVKGGPGFKTTRVNPTSGVLEEVVIQAAKSAARGTGVTLPGPQAAGITFGFINNSDILTMTLNALEQDGQTKTLTNPKIITTNNQNARIQIGSKVPFKTTTVTGTGVATESIKFVDVGFIINVTPTINVDNRIALKVKPEVSEVADATVDPPTIDTTVAETEVMIKDGETLVIGGLVSEKMIETASKVPLLGDLPVLGVFFRSTTNSKRRKEILIFVTARVVPD